MLPARAPGRRKRGGEKDRVDMLDIGRGEEARDRSGRGAGGTLVTEDARWSRELRHLPGLGSPRVEWWGLRPPQRGRGGGREANGRANRGGTGKGRGRGANGRTTRREGGAPGRSRANGKGVGAGAGPRANGNPSQGRRRGARGVEARGPMGG